MQTIERYFPLSNLSIPEFLEDVPEVDRLLGSDRSKWTAREVGDGNLNAVYIVGGQAGSLIVKQALPYLRLVGDAWPLPLERSYFEYLALTEATAHASHLVPRIHHFDRTMAAIVMEYLSPHIILRKGFIRGIVYPKLADDLAEFTAQTLFKTSDLYLPAAVKKARMQLFCANTELCRITEDLVFTDPYRQAKLNRWTSPELDETAALFRRDTELRLAVQRLKFKFLSCRRSTGPWRSTFRLRDGHPRRDQNHRSRICILRPDGFRCRGTPRESAACLLCPDRSRKCAWNAR